MTGMPTIRASFIAFLSGHASVTRIILASVKISSWGFVKIPGGYLLLKTFVPVNLPKSLTASQPFSLLLTISMS